MSFPGLVGLLRKLRYHEKHSFFNGFNGRATLLDSARVILALVPCYLNCLTSLYCFTGMAIEHQTKRMVMHTIQGLIDKRLAFIADANRSARPQKKTPKCRTEFWGFAALRS